MTASLPGNAAPRKQLASFSVRLKLCRGKYLHFTDGGNSRLFILASKPLGGHAYGRDFVQFFRHIVDEKRQSVNWKRWYVTPSCRDELSSMWSNDLSRGKLRTGDASDRHESPPKKWQYAINFPTTEMTTIACRLKVAPKKSLP